MFLKAETKQHMNCKAFFQHLDQVPTHQTSLPLLDCNSSISRWGFQCPRYLHRGFSQGFLVDPVRQEIRLFQVYQDVLDDREGLVLLIFREDLVILLVRGDLVLLEGLGDLHGWKEKIIYLINGTDYKHLGKSAVSWYSSSSYWWRPRLLDQEMDSIIWTNSGPHGWFDQQQGHHTCMDDNWKDCALSERPRKR